MTKTAELGSLGPYTVQSLMGSGSLGDSYLASDKHGTSVVLKVFRHEHPNDSESRYRFVSDLDAVRSARPRLFARVLDWEVAGPRPWVCFSYVEGRDLTELIREAPLPPERARRIATQLVDALAELEAAALVHGNLTPGNVRVGASDDVTVLDLGIASAPGWKASSLEESGRFDYLAPEQLRGATATPAVDAWAVGVITSQLCSLTHPFGAYLGRHSDFVDAIQSQHADLSDVPSSWLPFVKACLSHNPQTRGRPARLRLLLHGGAKGVALQLLTEARHWAEVPEPELAVDNLAQVALGFAQAGDQVAATEAAHRAFLAASSCVDRDRIDALHVVTSLFGHLGEPRSAYQAAKAMGDGGDDGAYALADAASALAKVGHVQGAKVTACRARDLASVMAKSDGRAFALAAVAEAFLQVGDVPAARETLLKAHDRSDSGNPIDDPGRRADVSLRIAEALLKTGDRRGSAQAALEGRGLANLIADPDRRAQVLARVAAASVRVGEVGCASEAAAEAFAIASENPFSWDVYRALESVIEVLSQDKNLSAAREVATAIGSVDRGAGVDAMVAIAAAFTRAGDLPSARQTVIHAWSIANGILEVDHRAWKLADVAEAFARVGETPSARQAAGHAVEAAKSVVDDTERDDAAARVARAFAGVGDFDRACALASTIGDQSDHLERIAVACAEHGHLDSARRVADAITYLPSRAGALARIAGIFAHSGDRNSASKAAVLAREATRSFGESDEPGPVLYDVVDAFVQAGDLNAARDMVDSLSPLGIEGLAVALAQAGEPEAARDLVFGSPEELWGYPLADIATAFVAGSDLNAALDLADRMDWDGLLHVAAAVVEFANPLSSGTASVGSLLPDSPT